MKYECFTYLSTYTLAYKFAQFTFYLKHINVTTLSFIVFVYKTICLEIMAKVVGNISIHVTEQKPTR